MAGPRVTAAKFRGGGDTGLVTVPPAAPRLQGPELSALPGCRGTWGWDQGRPGVPPSPAQLGGGWTVDSGRLERGRGSAGTPGFELVTPGAGGASRGRDARREPAWHRRGHSRAPPQSLEVRPTAGGGLCCSRVAGNAPAGRGGDPAPAAVTVPSGSFCPRRRAPNQTFWRRAGAPWRRRRELQGQRRRCHSPAARGRVVPRSPGGLPPTLSALGFRDTNAWCFFKPLGPRFSRLSSERMMPGPGAQQVTAQLRPRAHQRAGT
ncbi:translation initiation factor IF-2-like [Sciurus carolinensis]|uniref:translation initiation factor IF-2-like n=1 Tax=Sciurus carolinensis TaxID=30640 RepID=UPI001FB48F24|nr:translation initiation factor IF-2-like [Sciurus carolinensis]